MLNFVGEPLTRLKVIHKTKKLTEPLTKMLTQVEMAASTGLGITQFRKYLKKVLKYIESNRRGLITDDEVIVQEVNGKPQYHPIVLNEIKKGIKQVNETRYPRAVKTRKQHMGQRCHSTHKSAEQV